MSRIAVVAAGGASSRTGLGDYTTKAALSLRAVPGGQPAPLIRYQVDFARRSGADRMIVVAQVQHVRLLASLLSTEERKFVAFLAADWAPGWAARIEQALAFVDDDDQVLVYSCDNIQTARQVQWLRGSLEAFFTHTRWEETSSSPTNGPVFGRRLGETVWRQYKGTEFVGDFFSGYVIARGSALKGALNALSPSERGEKEITGLIRLFQHAHRTACQPYPGAYEDVSDLRSLALLHAGYSARDPLHVDVGAGVLLSDGEGHVLLIERQDGRGWVPPGGLVDEGESYVEAARRELEEETAVSVSAADLRLLGVYPTVGKDGRPACSVIFHTTVNPRPRVTCPASECRAHGWFGREKTGSLVIPFDLDRAVADHFDGKELDVR